MSLSLIANYGSDSEDDSSKSLPPPPSRPVPPSTSTRSSLFSAFPPPKQMPTPAAQPTQPKKVQIFVDLPTTKPDDDDDNSDSEREAKRKRTSSSLFSVLPPPKSISAVAGKTAPKSGVPITTTTEEKPVLVKPAATLVPHSVTKKKASNSAPKAVKQEEYTEDFFSIETTEPSYEETPSLPSAPKPPAPTPHPAQPTYSEYSYPGYYDYSQQYAYANPGPSAPPSSSHAQSTSFDPAPESGPQTYPQDLSDDAPFPTKQLRSLGIRKKDGPINFKNINQSEMLDDSWEQEQLRKTSMEKPSLGAIGRMGPVGGSLKRKHNIKSLAFEAKVRQTELQEAASTRMSHKRESRAKYGF
ncbi:hypothetical protein HK097_002445 [Rhizophlyctis rosea]|uniref:Proline-rich protein PRCC n=1 Tax=Rhizophlyctis rosea TaxID=64517 RepID=A0AAD5WXS8_9FUNG|nr:hypothetical protein HK097_002445 [Rhizophlyctis rosea]